MRICVLASGSKGNSTYVETNNHKILFWPLNIFAIANIIWYIRNCEKNVK